MSDVLNLGKMELVASMGDDLAVVQAARISNGAALPDWRGAPDERLIEFLAEHGHMTPFEHVTLKVYVKAPIFVIREWQRHRAFSYNEMSARYKKMRPEFYIPNAIRIPDPDNKQSSIEVTDPEWLEEVIAQMTYVYNEAWNTYESMIDAGVAREIARSVLPVGIYSEMYVTGNLRNWMHFYKLRSGADAQYEIRQYAFALGDIIEKITPLSFNALRRFGT